MVTLKGTPVPSKAWLDLLGRVPQLLPRRWATPPGSAVCAGASTIL